VSANPPPSRVDWALVLKRLLLIVVLLNQALVAVPGGRTETNVGQSTGQEGTAEQELIGLERAWGAAYLRRDTDALQRVLADDFTSTDALGTVSDKARYIMASVKAPATFSLASEFELDDVKVRVYADVAVVTGRATDKGWDRGPNPSGRYRFTDVFVRRQGRWQAVASQGTRTAH
jgi:ketosteroid isomerase-like protein